MTITNKKISLRFPRHLVDRPVVYHLIKDYNLELNILKATISSEEGHMVLELRGERADFDKGIEYLTKTGLIIDTLCREVTRNEARCTDCGACVTICPAQAFSVDSISRDITFDEEKCVVCGMCILSCPSRSMELHF
ncbi:4Fe-4S dicluster domain-containing protein [Dehalogenimonas formicexedens]|uniref:4Fe-4S dicluster domain-containing protein n=1 Tax=Dehalogenimonas formicexedens TaxID=1839801 RepID=A0A1P8F6K2_9CHLR|nr:NIL domain-containing protein [Dehalogenimonas formicexedens]APV44111.1 4Fe-4S dicluster domain-containing protein [Dehalogenimonas formicexedens]